MRGWQDGWRVKERGWESQAEYHMVQGGSGGRDWC